MLSGDAVAVDPLTFQNDMVNLKCRDDVITLLIHLGYLAYDSVKKKAFIPNEEVRQEFGYVTKDKRWSGYTKKQNRVCMDAKQKGKIWEEYQVSE